MRHSVALLLTICSVLAVAGCASEGGIFDGQSYDFIDPKLELSRDDYENMARPLDAESGEEAKKKNSKATPPLPEIAKILAAPKPPQLGKAKMVSLTVTDDVPLKDVLIELARLADVDIELGPGIQGGISFRAKDKPFSDVIARIADLAGLRYSIKDDVLRVEKDIPFLKNYSVDFLNVVRNSESEVSLATDVLSSGGGGGDGGGGGGGGSLTTGTTTSISSTTESDFWDALQSNLSEILNYVPVIELEAIEGDAQFAQQGNQGFDSGAANFGGGGGAGASGEGSASGRGADGAFYVVNRQAGILSVSASQRQHEMVKHYLALLERNASAQVLIEAKILEVELEQNYQSGVDWTAAIGNTDFGISYPTTITDGATVTLLGPGKNASGTGAANPNGDNNLGIKLDSLVQFTERFGTLRTLSSPRLHAVNNQQAVLTFAENRVFFEVEVQREDDQIVDGTVIPGTTTVETTRRSVPIGIVLNILPSINLDKNEVTLSVRPTLSRQVDSVQDPGSALVNADLSSDLQFTNEIPVIEVRELDSVMKLKSGSVMVIGGLMEDVVRNDDSGVPFVSSVPWLGNAFKSVQKQGTKRELIIFIKASIVNSTGNYDDADKTIYEKFSDDPRPLVF